MKVKFFATLIILLFISQIVTAQTAAQTPVGKWKTIDDETQEPKSVIEITQDSEGKLHGTIIQLFRGPDEDQDPTCDDCPGDKKDAKVIGMEIMWGLKWDKGDQDWQDGDIMDPDNGKTYDCYIAMESQEKLKVRGYIGFSLFGRTQYWYKMK